MASDPGLCTSCAHTREVGEGRFFLCTRSRNDPRYARYPRLPVVRCEGYEPRQDAPIGASRSDEPR